MTQRVQAGIGSASIDLVVQRCCRAWHKLCTDQGRRRTWALRSEISTERVKPSAAADLALPAAACALPQPHQLSKRTVEANHTESLTAPKGQQNLVEPCHAKLLDKHMQAYIPSDQGLQSYMGE